MARRLIQRNCSTCGKTVSRHACFMKAENIFCNRTCADMFGLIEVRCAWIHCESSVPVREKVVNGKICYRLRGKAHNRSFILCDLHESRAKEILNQHHLQLGSSAKFLNPDAVYDSRSLSVRSLARLWVYDRAKGQCESCATDLKFNDQKSWSIDHRVPLAVGGTGILSNLQILCRACHRVKTLDENRSLP